MRRTAIVLIVSTVLFWCSAAYCRRPPTTRWSGDPDEYQSTSVHEEKYASAPEVPGRTSLSSGSWLMLLGKLLWEVLYPGTMRPNSGEGR
jgi:hypothetical protein